jgi:hypothetical protein
MKNIECSCSDEKPFALIKCVELDPMSLHDQRELMRKESWIKNVMRIMEMDRTMAHDIFVKIALANSK